MKIRVTKILCAAAVVYVLTMTSLRKPETSAYTLQQTVEALGSVRNMHVIRRNESGDIEVERWIEINADGTQDKYFQETVGKYLVMEDATIRLIYIIEKNAILLYDRDDTSDTWLSDFNVLFEDMAKDDSVTIEDFKQKGQKLHIVRWSKQNIECCIDKETKLPIAIGHDEIYYEQVPVDVYNKFRIPKTAVIVDKRKAGKVDEKPDWSECLNITQNNIVNTMIALTS